MSIRIYLMPISGSGATSHDPRVPKYESIFSAFAWDMVDYGPEPACLVGIRDIDAGTHAELIVNADVIALPADLTQTIGAQLTLVQNTLISLHIPEDWVQSSFSYRTVLRVVVLVFLFMQRVNGTLPNVQVFGSGVTLGTRINQLPANVRQALIDAANSLGFSTAGLSGTSTLRQALKSMADQFSSIEVNAFGMTV